ncbi:MAG: YqcI/YcgG family protein, partial [Pseudomonadota bacterium]|nr:YqcI/YcgG family protein [Pseudomonadota bacterium]
MLEAEDAFSSYIEQEDFPCLAAKTAIARDRVTFFHGSSIECPAHDRALLAALIDFAQPSDSESPFRSFAALFPTSVSKTPQEFESALWQQLQRLHDLDVLQSPWDKTVSCDPGSPNFSMSLGGHAFYVVG